LLFALPPAFVSMCVAAAAAFLLLRGLKTLALRVERQSANAAALAAALERHPLVSAAAISAWSGAWGGSEGVLLLLLHAVYVCDY
jgi:hypothetical protein